mmetsp:Transcript_37951/g.78839  ORF Transcript_37951/g.78839 Transcript_37951/m.78839 type:complete len:85 (+) Transcript_37951:76-330(+)
MFVLISAVDSCLGDGIHSKSSASFYMHPGHLHRNQLLRVDGAWGKSGKRDSLLNSLQVILRQVWVGKLSDSCSVQSKANNNLFS